MTALLEKAFREAETLPQAEQDELAQALLVMLRGIDAPDEAEEKAWDVLVSSERSQRFLEKMASEVLAEDALPGI